MSECNTENKIFPEDFIWGTATASYQVEGGGLVDGKGESIWNEFEQRPGAICNDVTGEVTCDQYHRYREDVRHMRELGTKAYRFSISWSRVLPDGSGAINQKGLDYYKELCDELLANGIEPYMTWYHWDLPLALQREQGGWESRETVKRFGEFVERITPELQGRVKNFFTTNEFMACSDGGYRSGIIAPGLKLSGKRCNQIRHHVLLAHGTALAALRTVAPLARVGLAENPWFMVPIIDTPEHVAAAKLAFREENAHFLTAVMEGCYLDTYLEKCGADAPAFTDEEMRLIHGKIDFLGLNIYFGKYVQAVEGPEKYQIFHEDAASVAPGVANLHFEPDAMYWGVRFASELWKVPEILVSENGISSRDVIDLQTGAVNDLSRIKFLRTYMASLGRAVSEHYPAKGYFHWSLLDNLEWNQGFDARFGLIYVNFRTLERIPKQSYYWYQKLIQTGRLV